MWINKRLIEALQPADGDRPFRTFVHAETMPEFQVTHFQTDIEDTQIFERRATSRDHRSLASWREELSENAPKDIRIAPILRDWQFNILLLKLEIAALKKVLRAWSMDGR